MTDVAHDVNLSAVLANSGPVLLDFDGPVTDLMPDGVDRAIADDMRAVLRSLAGHVPGEISQTKDPLTVLRVTAASEPTATLAAVEDVCRGGEISAAVRSAPTPGAHDLLRVCRDAGRPVVIVSNNAPEAIAVYLDRHALRDLVRGVAARPQGRPDLMKPHPELVHRALQLVDQAPTRCVFIGDSVTDVQVGRRTGVRSIGYAKTPERGQQLMEAGADAVVSAMSDLVEGIQRACRVSVDP